MVLWVLGAGLVALAAHLLFVARQPVAEFVGYRRLTAATPQTA